MKPIADLKNTEKFKKGSLEHIVEGQLNARGKAVGFHYEGMPTAKGKNNTRYSSAKNAKSLISLQGRKIGNLKKAAGFVNEKLIPATGKAVKDFGKVLKNTGEDLKGLNRKAEVVTEAGVTFKIGNDIKLSDVGNNLKNGVKDIGDNFVKTIKSGDGVSNAENTLDPKLEKYVQDSFEGLGKEAQDNFNKYLRENVWCDETLSNAEKIDIMKANFDKLTPEQKINFNVSNEVRVLKNPDYSNWGEWPDIDWPGFPGLNKDTVKSVYNEATGKIKIPNNVDRLGSPYGNNLGVVEDGHHCTQDERSICYIENKYARNSYKFHEEYYKDAIDAIKDFDIENPTEYIDKLNSVIKQNNELTGDSKELLDSSNIDDIATVSDMKDFYDKFQNQCSDFCNAYDVDSTYGLMGKADEWNINGETICTGGAGQINTPIDVQSLERLGILKNNGGW